MDIFDTAACSCYNLSEKEVGRKGQPSWRELGRIHSPLDKLMLREEGGVYETAEIEPPF